MMGCDEVPGASVPRIGFDGMQVTLNVQTPRRRPTGKFGLKFGPLFRNANCILTFMVEQQGGGLDEPLYQKHLFNGCLSGLQSVPKVLPRFMCMPKRTPIEAVEAFLKKLAFTDLKGLRFEPAHGSTAGMEVETLRLWPTRAALFKRGQFGSRSNGAVHVDGGSR